MEILLLTEPKALSNLGCFLKYNMHMIDRRKMAKCKIRFTNHIYICTDVFTIYEGLFTNQYIVFAVKTIRSIFAWT